MSKTRMAKKPLSRNMEDSDMMVETTSRYIVRSRVVINPLKKIKNPTQALLDLGIRMNLDAVKLVKEVRENF